MSEKDRPRKWTYSQFHRMLITAIKSDTVFVDIPIHFKIAGDTHLEVIKFLRPMIDVDARIQKLKELNGIEKMVPVISSYHAITGKTGSVKQQVNGLRKDFPRLAFRITAQDPGFESEMDQVEPCITAADHLIVDFGEDPIGLQSDSTKEIITRLSSFNTCPVVVLRSAIPNSLTYKSMENGTLIDDTDNRLLLQYKDLSATGFGDYVGIKKDNLVKSGGSENTVYGFVYFDATENKYYGFKGDTPGREALKRDVIPKIISSEVSKRMSESAEGFLSPMNKGWILLHDEKTSSPADLKRVSMKHYLHCIKAMIEYKDFD